MSDIALRVQNVSKKYHIGVKQQSHLTLSAHIAKKLKKFFHSNRGSNNCEDTDILWVLKDISFEVKKGEVLGIVGQNGAGKSTLLKILSHITLPTTGRVEIYGKVGSLLEVGTGFHPELTGRDNVYLNAAVLGMHRKDVDKKFDEIIAFAEVEKFVDTPIKHYSSGMYMRLAFAVAAHIEPDILIVDEVLSVGDARFQKKCLEKISSVTQEGRTVLFVSHNTSSIEKLCTHGIMLLHGSIEKIGEINKVTNQYENYLKEMEEAQKNPFPITNNIFGITLESVTSQIESHGENELNLIITFCMHFEKDSENIGVGVIIFTHRGIRVSRLGANITGFILEKIPRGKIKCSITVENIDCYVAGGDYNVDVNIARPSIESLMRVNNATQFSLPPKDIYNVGRMFKQTTHGIVPLKATFKIDQGATVRQKQ